MKRVASAVVLLAVLVAVWVVASGTSGDGGDGPYEVRAIFDNAAAAAPGEDVKIAGVRVGSIAKLEVTEDRKAAITLRIDDRRFTPFHTDATCTLRPEGVLAVKLVACEPGTRARPALRRIRRGDGAGTYLLPVTRTSSPVDPDLINNSMRRPTGQQLAILLAEFGTGLAGRGDELNAVIHRANPALTQTDEVLKILAAQNERLAQFAADADTVFAPLARDRRAIAGFIKGAGATARASASRSGDVSRSIERLPAFLRDLRAQMAQLSTLAQAGTPVFEDLGRAAPGLSDAMRELGPFSTASTPAIESLGATARRATPALQRTTPLIRELRSLGITAKPVVDDLAALTTSFDKQSGIRRLLETAYYGTNALNGFDDVGHYARAEPLSGSCSEYTARGFFGCDAQWGPSSDAIPPITEGSSASLVDWLLAP